MARRGFLDYVLGGAVGGLEGLAQKRAAEEERKRMADAAAMDRARLLMQLNYRVAPDEYDTIDPAARSILPSLEMPSTARPSLSPMTMPSIAPRPSAGVSRALSAALNRDFKVDPTQPSITRPGFGAPPLAMDRSGSNMMKRFEAAKYTRAAQEAIAASVDLGDGLKVRFNAPESAAQIAAKKLTEYETQKRADAVKRAFLVNAWTAAGATPEQAIAYSNAGVAVPANRLAAPVKKLKPWEEQGFASEKEFRAYESRNPKPAIAGSQPTQEELDEAEAAFNSPFRKEMAPIMSAFRTRGDNRPPQVLMLAAWRVVKARSGILETLGGAKPLPKSATEADAEDQALKAGVEARKNARKGGTSVTPSPAPQAATPAPATVSDAAYKRSQRGALWESIKASNPTLSDADITAQVIRRIP